MQCSPFCCLLRLAIVQLYKCVLFGGSGVSSQAYDADSTTGVAICNCKVCCCHSLLRSGMLG